MGTRGKMYLCVWERESERDSEGQRDRTQILWLALALTQRDTHTHSKIPITFPWLSPLEQSSLCGCCSSLSGLFGSRSGGH